MDSSKFYLSILENLDEGILVLDSMRKVQYWSRGAEKLTGYTVDEVKGLTCPFNCISFDVIQSKGTCSNNCRIHSIMETGKGYSEDIAFMHKDGYRMPVTISAIPWLSDNENKIIGTIEILRDASDLAKAKHDMKVLESLSLIDVLTEIGNRRMGEMRLATKLEEYNRYGTGFGILFIDIDYFKKINDEYGHDAGDRVLKIVAKTLKFNTRSFDEIIRWGGEEFLSIVSNVNKHQIVDVAEKLRKLVQETIVSYGTTNLSVTVSIGATIVNSEDNRISLINRADNAMYESKKNGRNMVTIKT
jgi:diguanylate cyclase (GGDEF)-like protein/PAS domain S-box-containing protein